jgi:hypothetical protein
MSRSGFNSTTRTGPARLRQSFVGQSRRFAAQSLVPHDRHGRWAVAIVVLTMLPQSRIGFLMVLPRGALHAASSRHDIAQSFASYGRHSLASQRWSSPAIYSVRPGAQTARAFTLALTRVGGSASGIVCAGIVVAGNGFGRRGTARRPIRPPFRQVTAGLSDALAGQDRDETRSSSAGSHPARHRARAGHRRSDRRNL